MLNGRQLATFRKQLLGWFRQFQRDLPWRRTRDPYRIWLSEIMLQQTRVAAAIPYYERFLQRFPDVRTLAAAPQEQVLRLWSGLGYYSRARNLQKAAKEIVTKHSGEFPTRLNDALALPGIGNYTAAAILSIAFGEKHAVLDGNVARVLARLGAICGDTRESRHWQASADHVPTLVSKMWHFPALSVSEEPAEKLSAFLRELMPGVQSRDWQLVPAGKVRHAVTFRAITLLPFLIEVRNLPRFLHGKQVPLNDITSLPVSNLTRKVARAALAVTASLQASTESYPFARPRFRRGPQVLR